MRIVVSGAAGFIGSHFCDRLLAEGHTVVGLDNFLTGAARNLAHLADEPRFSLIRHDITEPFSIAGAVDAVVNMASPASPKDYLRTPDRNPGRGLGRHAAHAGTGAEKSARFLLTSTSECYGDPVVHPQVETYWGNVNPVGPRSCYDESKRFAEALTMAYHRKHGLPTNIARIFNTYGPRMKLDDGRVVPAFLWPGARRRRRSRFSATARRPAVSATSSDLVDGLYRLMLSEERYPVNLGNPREMTILEFAEHIRRLTGSQSPTEFRPLPEDDPKQRCPDIGKARKALGWEPRVTLEDGLRLTVEYFQREAAAGTNIRAS